MYSRQLHNYSQSAASHHSVCYALSPLHSITATLQCASPAAAEWLEPYTADITRAWSAWSCAAFHKHGKPAALALSCLGAPAHAAASQGSVCHRPLPDGSFYVTNALSVLCCPQEQCDRSRNCSVRIKFVYMAWRSMTFAAQIKAPTSAAVIAPTAATAAKPAQRRMSSGPTAPAAPAKK